MSLLRILNFKIINSNILQITFSENVSKNITVNNFKIVPFFDFIPSPKILSLIVSDNVVEITTLPMTPYMKYWLQLISPFELENGFATLNSSNYNFEFLSYEDSSLFVQDNLIKNLEKNYDLSWNDNSHIFNKLDIETSISIRDLVNFQGIAISKLIFDIKELKNDNYLDLLIVNEPKIRGAGPYDRLNEGGAFEIVKVTKNLDNQIYSESTYFESFPNTPIHLQAETITEEINPSFKNFTFKVSKNNILQVSKIIFKYIDDEFEYPIDILGYQINNNLFAQNNSSSYLLLEENEIKLNSKILDYSRLPSISEIIEITYVYQNKGKIILEDSVECFELLKIVREVVPPITTQFYIKNFPIVDENQNIIKTGGLQFLDPHSNPPFADIHPAFLKEKTFDLNALPEYYGEYSVNYETGQVIVYGLDGYPGTGDYPPVVSYWYKKTLLKNVDYTYDHSTYQLAASPIREMIGSSCYLFCEFEKNLIPFVDFVPQIHSEILNERVENRITSTISLNVKNHPITNVFRIFNETTGEVYSINRWNDYSVFFTGTPPTIKTINQEKVTFEEKEEVIIFITKFLNENNIEIFELNTSSYPIIGVTQDCIGSSFNSSISFENKEIFINEKYYDWQTDTLSNQLNQLTVGQYIVDYNFGKIYVATSNIEDYNFGNIFYRFGNIKTQNKHLYFIDKLSFDIPIVGNIESINIDYFTDGYVVPKTYKISDERFFNNDDSQSYFANNDQIQISSIIYELRGVYDLFDLKNNLEPLNFASVSTFENKTISLGTIKITTTGIINNDLTIELEQPFTGVSIADVVSVSSNGVEYWDNNGVINNFILQLSGINSPNADELVTIILNYKLNGAATPVIDYSSGNYLINYKYIADEILISYEYGDNLLDFRQSSNILQENERYYVTYKVGALRQALLNNFGTIFNIPLLNQINFSLTREEYRDVLKATMGTVTKGPKISALKNLIKTITHIEPELIEDLFCGWSLGNSYFEENNIIVVGDPEIVPAKFDNGIFISNKNQWIEAPVCSNIKLEQGSFETWIIPKWDGLDNDAELTCQLYKNGSLISPDKIYLGSFGQHPILDKNGKFILSEKENYYGLPNQIFLEEGFFIYFDIEINKWKFLVKSSTQNIENYSGTINSSGSFYGVSHIKDLGEINDFIRTHESKIEFEFNLDNYDAQNPDGYVTDGYLQGFSFDGLQFMSDNQHYIFDIGDIKKNRLSLLKDSAGYLVFKIIDSFGKINEISHNIQNWKENVPHHLACSWQINNADKRDEMHLFVDGFEVPNILKFGGKPQIIVGDIYRRVKPEIILSSATKNSIFFNDLVTEINSNTVTSSINFENRGIVSGDTILLIEFNQIYTIISVNENSLTLNEPMAFSLEDIYFSINPLITNVSTKISFYTNSIIKILRNDEEFELKGPRAQIPEYAISKDEFGKDVITIFGNLEIGDKVSLLTVGLNHQKYSQDIYLWAPSPIIKTVGSEPIDLNEINITSILLPKFNSTQNTAQNISDNIWEETVNPTQPSNSIDGKILKINISSSNIDYSFPVTVTINGQLADLSTQEILYFNSSTSQNTTGKILSISSVIINCTVYDNSKPLFVIEITEANSIFEPGDSVNYPIIKYSYVSQSNNTMISDGTDVVVDENIIFLDDVVGQYLIISSPIAGAYKIISRIDEHTLKVNDTILAYSNISYTINYLIENNGAYQNGYLTLQNINNLSPYVLPIGYYKIEYSTYLNLSFDAISNEKMIIGNDLTHLKPSLCILDEIKTSSIMLQDLRIGEAAISGKNYVTSNYLKTKPHYQDKYTLMLLHCDDIVLKNFANFYSFFDKEYLQSSDSVNNNFKSSFAAFHSGIEVENFGLLNNNEGSIQFWINPKYDTVNDYNDRYYFDASSYVSENVISTTSTIIKLTENASKIIAIYLQTDSQNIGKNYFDGSNLSEDNKTIDLNKSLPNYNTPVKIFYIPLKLKGNRFSILKNKDGYVSVKISSGDDIFEKKLKVYWPRNTWHKILVNYKFNKTNSLLQILCDGNDSDLFSDSDYIDYISFNDPINSFNVGSDFYGYNVAQARIDNLKISNKISYLWNINSQMKDLSFQGANSLPSVEDLYTTFLLNFDTESNRISDISILKDDLNGFANFTLNIFDSFEIVSKNSQIKEILETLIKLFKPSNSKVTINYL